MNEIYTLLAVSLAPLLLLFGLIEFRIRRRERKMRGLKEMAEKLGLAEPVSLHPWIDPDQCIGSGACVSACPEKNVLGIIDGRASLINGSVCIGHGACEAACPMEAITLVFGTARRGIDIPRVSPDFETSVPGMYLAGEVGGMGLIRNAVEQGRQAAEAIMGSLAGAGPAPDGVRDFVVIGGGPAGISAARAMLAKGADCLVVEQEDPGGAILSYPRGKIILTRPIEMPGMPVVKGPRLTKEQLMDFIEVAAADLEVQTRARVVDVRDADELFDIELAGGEVLQARRVLLAVGRRGSPRKLGVPGEDQGKVVYKLLDPDRYEGQKVLVVGGGNSAVESAIMLADVPDTKVWLSYRSDTFRRVAPETRDRLEKYAAEGKVELLLKTNVTKIDYDVIHINGPDGDITVPADGLIVQIGGTVPTAFLRKCGVLVDVHHGRKVITAEEAEEASPA